MTEKKETTEELLESIKKKYRTLSEDLPTELPYNAHVVGVKRLPLMVEYVKAGLKYRIVSLSKTTIDVIEKKELLASFVLIRSIFETASMFYSVYYRLNNIVKNKDLEDIFDYLMRIIAGSKTKPFNTNPKGEEIKAVNILTAIKKIQKLVPDIQKEYDFISEYAHPNCGGANAFFSELDKGNDIIKYSLDNIYNVIKKPEFYPIILFASSIDIFIYSEERIDELIPEFTKLCNETH